MIHGAVMGQDLRTCAELVAAHDRELPRARGRARGRVDRAPGLRDRGRGFPIEECARIMIDCREATCRGRSRGLSLRLRAGGGAGVPRGADPPDRERRLPPSSEPPWPHLRGRRGDPPRAS